MNKKQIPTSRQQREKQERAAMDAISRKAIRDMLKASLLRHFASEKPSEPPPHSPAK